MKLARGLRLARGGHLMASAPYLLILLSLLLSACGGSSSDNDEGGTQHTTVHDGQARFQILSPTLVRLEYAEDGQFEDGPTQTVAERLMPAVSYTTAVENGVRVIRTRALTLRYQQGSGPFTPQNLEMEVKLGSNIVKVRPDWAPNSNPDNLGGWLRGLDNEQNPVPMHDGLLSRAGWYLLDDSQTVRLTHEPPGFKVRPGRAGRYQDGYLFGYGHEYAQGLADLRLLTGAAPLLPRKAFGVWFSRYWAYSDAEYRDLVAQFRAHNVPLDTLSIDTNWKRVHNPVGCIFFSAVAGARPGDPCSWNGWDWNRDLFPDPEDFKNWARGQGLQLAFNIHPSISSTDARFAETQALSGGLATDSSMPPCTLFQADPLAQCHVFDWTNPKHLDAYFALHVPLADGVDFWWLDWCCDGSHAVAPGLTADTWINAQYAKEQASRGSRWPVFSRIGASFQEGKDGIANNGAGAFAEHRYTLHFTGDTCGTWQMLAFEAEMTAAEGNIGMPYVTHDIGSFLGPPTTTGCNGVLGHTSHLPDDMYVRWVQFGTFQPLDRLHSHHGDRLPWEYPGVAEQVATDFLRLRERLIPHLYTLSRQAHDTGLPMVRSLYLQWPELDAAYEHRTQYTLGNDVLVATVAAPGDPATVDVWIPPGTWFDYFTGESLTGPAVVSRSVPLNRYPLFLRAGAILPTQPDLLTSTFGPQDHLVLSVWPGASGAYDLYEDEGKGFGYRHGAYSWTRLASGATAAGCRTVSIGAAAGNFPGKLTTRSWTVRLLGMPAPSVVKLGVQSLPAASWSYDETTQTLTLDTGPRSTSVPLKVVAGPAACEPI